MEKKIEAGRMGPAFKAVCALPQDQWEGNTKPTEEKVFLELTCMYLWV